MKNNVRGIVNLFNAPSLGVLTKTRNYGSVTFLGRYGLIDFILSDFTNSGIDEIDILVDAFPTSLRRHISEGSTFLINTKLGGITLITDESGKTRKEYNNEITAILANNFKPEKINADYVIIAPAHMLYNCDFKPYIEEHIRSGKDITVLGKEIHELDEKFRGCHLVKTDKDGSVLGLPTYRSTNKSGVLSLETYILSKDLYASMIKEQPEINKAYGFYEMFAHYIKENRYSFAYLRYKGFVLPITSLEAYLNNSFWLLPYPNRQLFFNEDLPIYTTTHDTPPVLYTETAEVKNSFVANGSVIKGKVINSIISRNVLVDSDAVVEDSILFTGTEVGKNAKLKYVLTDKGAVINKNKSVKGKKDEFSVIALGETK